MPALANGVTALPPVVSLLAAFGANVPPPLPPGADFLAILTAAEESAPGPAPELPNGPPKDGQQAPAEKQKKEASAEPLPVPWVSVPLPAAPQPAPPPIAIELPFSPPADVPVNQPAAAPPAPLVQPPTSLGSHEIPPLAVMTKPDAPEPQEPEPQTPAAVNTPRAAVVEESPVVEESAPMLVPEKAPPKTEAIPQAPAESAPPMVEAKATPRKRTVETPPLPAREAEAAPEEPRTLPAPQAPVSAAPQPAVEIAPVAPVTDIAPPKRSPEVRAQPALAFSARLVTAKPAHADAKVSAATASASAPEPQRRNEPPPPEESKARGIRPPEDSDVVSEGPREQPGSNALPPRDPPVQNAPDRAEPSKMEASKPVVHAGEAPADPPKASPIARDIRLEVGGADRKVELRVIERAGEVQVAVRTPDERLAGTLRDHLPLLSSRLEQSGFHADQWKAADAGGAERRFEVRSAAESSGRAPEHHGGEQRQQQEEQQRPQPADERKKSQEKGKAFEWLMQSLR